jgi:RNA polymerase sigma factor (sigma-70 family)
VIEDTISHCWDHDQRILRRYQDRGKPFSSWLFTLATRRAQYACRSQRTWERTHVSSDEILDDFTSRQPSIDDLLETESLMRVVFEALSRLGAECREVIAAVADGHKPREITQSMRLPPEAAKMISKRIRHCRDRLIRLLEADGVYVAV